MVTRIKIPVAITDETKNMIKKFKYTDTERYQNTNKESRRNKELYKTTRKQVTKW